MVAELVADQLRRRGSRRYIDGSGFHLGDALFHPSHATSLVLKLTFFPLPSYSRTLRSHRGKYAHSAGAVLSFGYLAHTLACSVIHVERSLRVPSFTTWRAVTLN